MQASKSSQGKARKGKSRPSKGRQILARQGKARQGKEITGNSREHNSWLGHFTHFQRKKFLERQQQAIGEKANPGNTMLNKTIPGKYRN